MRKYFPFFPFAISKLTVKRNRGQPFFTRYGSLITSALVHTIYWITRACIYRSRGERGVCVRFEFFPQPLKMCRYHVCFFPFHLIFNSRAYIRGLCATGGSYYSAALNTRGLVLVWFMLGVAATACANVCHVRATLKSRFAESQVGQPDVAFPRGKLYSRIKVFFSEFLVAEHYCFPNPSAGFLPSSFSTFQTSIKKSDVIVHFLSLLYIFFYPNSDCFRGPFWRHMYTLTFVSSFTFCCYHKYTYLRMYNT